MRLGRRQRRACRPSRKIRSSESCTARASTSWASPAAGSRSDGDVSRGVDGFRLDAPENVPHPFWVAFRKEVKSINPDAYIDGEIWNWAQSYLSGDQFDAVMNYQFAIPAQAFFVNIRKAIPVSEFNNRLNLLIYPYPFLVSLGTQDLFDSHDSDRVASMFVNPDLAYDAANRIQDNGPHYSARKPNAQERLRMFQEEACQMTFVGAPMIYYGDEAGMWSPDDPSDREPMLWKELGPYEDPEMQFDQSKFDWYERLIAIHRQLPALQTGFFHAVKMDDAHNIYAYARELGNQQVFVVLNRTAAAQSVELPIASGQDGQYVDWLNDGGTFLTEAGDRPDARPQMGSDRITPLITHGGVLSVQLKPWGVAILTRTRN